MTIRRLGLSNYYFLRRRQLQAFSVDSAAVQFLAPFKGDPIAMRDLRHLMQESSRGGDAGRLTDDQVIAAVADLIRSGELVVASDWGDRGIARGAPKGDPPPAEATAPKSGGKKSQDPEAATLPPNTNAAAQAATLSAAAASGAAFCPT